MAYAATSEIVGLPGVPGTERGFRKFAQRVEIPARPRQGRGGGQEYLVEALPAPARIAYAARQASNAPTAAETEAAHSIQQSRLRGTQHAANATGWQRERQEGVAQVLALFRRFHSHLGGSLTPAFRAFCAAWGAGQVEADDALRQRYPSLGWSTLRGWYLAVQANGLSGITPREHHRKGQFKALAGDVGNAVLAMLVDKPHLSATAIYMALQTQFADLPSERAFRRALAYWKEQNAQLFTAVTNPDAWRNRFLSAAGRADEHITRPNQMWQLDSTPGDVMLNDGKRHAVIGVIDVFTRRRMFLVSRTSRSGAIMALMRRAIAAWGMPEGVKTDNGKDYVANQFDTALIGLGIAHELCPPFTPQAKPHIERAIGALMHEHFELLDGYIGHDVAQRKAIEARRAFSDRLFDKSEHVELRLAPEQLQAGIDAYCERLHDSTRAELKGATPNERAQGFVPVQAPERALDVLLAPSAGSGLRTIGKKGIRIEGGNYNHAHLGGMEGQQVQVKVDEANLGRCWVFTLDGVFVCEALDYERLGINSAEVASARRAHQAMVMRESKRQLKAVTREFDTRAAIEQITARRTQEAVAQASNVVSLPGQRLHSTPAIDSIVQAAAPAVDAAQVASAQAALAQRRSTPAQVIALADNPQVRFARWLKLQERVERGERLTSDERNWFEGYAQGPEWASMQRYFTTFGLDADQVLNG